MSLNRSLDITAVKTGSPCFFENSRSTSVMLTPRIPLKINFIVKSQLFYPFLPYVKHHINDDKNINTLIRTNAVKFNIRDRDYD